MPQGLAHSHSWKVTFRSLRILRMISQAAGEVGLMPCSASELEESIGYTSVAMHGHRAAYLHIEA